MWIISKQIVVLISILFTPCISLCAQKDGAQLFDPSLLHEIRIEAVDKINLWDTISRDYIMVNVIIDGNIIDSVGLKLKGSTSIYSEQKPLELDFNEFVKGKKYDGLKKIGIRNNFKDPYLQKERLAYDLYRRAGLPSPRTSFAEVFVDDIFKGVYTIVEVIDKTFLKNYYPSNNGSLYKGAFGFAGFSVELEEGTMTEFERFKDSCTFSNIGDFVNLDHYMKQLAIDIIIGDWDSYAYHRHNFYIFFETKSERLHFINWDHNYAFSAKPEDKDFYPKGTFPFHYNLIETPSLQPLYEHTMCELLTYLVDMSFITDLTTFNYNIIKSNSHDVNAAEPSDLIQYIKNRKERLQDTLAAIGVNCSSYVYPYDPNDLVVNEFVAANGDESDWIELYNNTPSDIILDKRYYLSDDKAFPKKWNFPGEIVIPSMGYLIVWADNKINRPGLHTGFKLDKSGGDLLLTYENMTEIQNIKYGMQKKNMGYARVPNGIGDFKIQSPTFQASNTSIIDGNNN